MTRRADTLLIGFKRRRKAVALGSPEGRLRRWSGRGTLDPNVIGGPAIG